MDRRKFIELSSWASTSVWAPHFIKALGVPVSSSRSGSNLIIIQLSGGNDGLNTVIPYSNDLYYEARPTLAIDKNLVLKLNDYQGLNPALKGMKSIFDQGQLCLINSVGYPNPDRSHFRSMDIWHTGSGSEQTWQSGWIGRYLDSRCDGCDKPHYVLEIGEDLNLAMKGNTRKGFIISNAATLEKTTRSRLIRRLSEEVAPSTHELTNYLYKTMVETVSSVGYLVEKSNAYKSPISYPNTKFGRDLKQVAQLITTDSDTKIYYVSLSGFDTHARQQGTQTRLLTQYDEAVRAFVDDLKHHHLFDDSLIMTFSEFGRRVKENGSRGTDHGAANNVSLISGKLNKPGIYNPPADLDNLDNGDLKYSVDFRSIYAELLNNWLGVDAQKILKTSYESLGIL